MKKTRHVVEHNNTTQEQIERNKLTFSGCLGLLVLMLILTFVVVLAVS